MPDVTELVKTIKKAAIEAVNATKPAEFLFGNVININPLKISIDQKLILGEKQLILCRNVTDFKLDMTVTHETEDYEINIDTSHNHGEANFNEQTAHIHKDSLEGLTDIVKIETTHSHNNAGSIFNITHNHNYKGKKTFLVHNRLAVGDEVILLRQQGGQKYIVIDRIE